MMNRVTITRYRTLATVAVRMENGDRFQSDVPVSALHDLTALLKQLGKQHNWSIRMGQATTEMTALMSLGHVGAVSAWLTRNELQENEDDED